MKGAALSRLVRRGVSILLLAGVYLAFARLGMQLALPGEHVSPIWPPVGIALGALLLWGRWLWPGIWLGSLTADLLNGASPALALFMSIGSVLAPVIGAELLRRLRFRPSLERPVGVVML
ncbi:MAG: MASE1 domain-containing protein, partial [Candidatus Binatia bacterium]